MRSRSACRPADGCYMAAPASPSVVSVEGRPEEGRQGHALGASAFQSPTDCGCPVVLTVNPLSTGGSHVMQVVDGKVIRTIAPMVGAGAVPGPRPARRGEMRVCNHSAGMGIALRARGPVHTRTVDGKEQVLYRSREMDEGRLYAVEWNGGHYALRKSGPYVEIFKFRPDGGDDGDTGGGGSGRGECERKGPRAHCGKAAPARRPA